MQQGPFFGVHLSTEPDSPKAAKRSRNFRRRLVAYGSIFAILYGIWLWTPWEYDLIPPERLHLQPADPDSARFFSSGTKVAVVTAHPDDAEFYLGGTLTNLSNVGADIQLITCTDGDKGYYPFEDWKANSIVRRREQTAASSAWHGRTPIFLGFPDGRSEVNEAMVRGIQRELERFKPDYVLCFDGYYPTRLSHRDHRRAGRAAEIATRRLGTHLWICRFSTVEGNWFSNIENYWDDKSALLAIHRSQFHGAKLEGIRARVYENAESDGQLGRITLAEGMRVEKL